MLDKSLVAPLISLMIISGMVYFYPTYGELCSFQFAFYGVLNLFIFKLLENRKKTSYYKYFIIAQFVGIIILFLLKEKSWLMLLIVTSLALFFFLNKKYLNSFKLFKK